MSTVAAEAPLVFSEVWRRVRAPVVLIGIGLALALALAAVAAQPRLRPLDPRSTDPDGARALAALLHDRGTGVSRVTTLPPALGGGTVVVADPAGTPTGDLTRLAGSSADLVVLAPEDRELRTLGVPATADGTATSTLDPGCALSAAAVAGAVRISGVTYRTTSPTPAAVTDRCYVQDGDAALLTVTRPGGGRTTVFGSPSTLVNARLADEGDAALGLGLLATPTVTWLLPDAATARASATRTGLIALLPSRLLWAVLELAVAGVLLALWRGRRLGAPVLEPLPVVVRAAETVEGRGRLLRAAGARDSASAALRTATVRRLAAALRMGTDPDPKALAALVAERAGRPGPSAYSLLYGAPPVDDAALVRLARDLDDLAAAAAPLPPRPSGGQQ